MWITVWKGKLLWRDDSFQCHAKVSGYSWRGPLALVSTSTLEVGKLSGDTVQTPGKQHGAMFQVSLFPLSDSCSIVPGGILDCESKPEGLLRGCPGCINPGVTDSFCCWPAPMGWGGAEFAQNHGERASSCSWDQPTPAAQKPLCFLCCLQNSGSCEGQPWIFQFIFDLASVQGSSELGLVEVADFHGSERWTWKQGRRTGLRGVWFFLDTILLSALQRVYFPLGTSPCQPGSARRSPLCPVLLGSAGCLWHLNCAPARGWGAPSSWQIPNLTKHQGT